MSGYADLDVESSSDYLKLVSASAVNFNILSRNPQKQVIHWIDKKKSSCLGTKNCEYCLQGDKPKTRWTIDVFDRKEQKVKKLEFGAMIATQFKAIAEMLAESNQTIHDVDIRIKTVGTGLETEYSVLNMPLAAPVPVEIEEKYKGVPF